MVTLGRAGAVVVAGLLAGLAALTGLAACSAGAPRDGDDTSTGGAPLALEQVRLPAGVAPVAVTAAGDRVLVGGRAPDGSSVRPRLYLGPDAARLVEVPVAPVSPTAFEA
ncbi:MAG: hypothetical protein ACRCZD_19985, partial [Phycicoccus sp.]